MPPTRTKRPTPPAEVISSTYLSNIPSPSFPGSLSLPGDKQATSSQKKRRSHGKSRPPGHIPRPPNAFICFRTDYIKAMETQNSTPEVSKSLGELWRSMSDEERQPWIEKAHEKKLEHQAKYPDYKFKPIHPRDEHGNCIRKPRKPNNKPRALKLPQNDDVPEDLSTSFRMMEGWPFHSGPSSVTDPSPPPPSPPIIPTSSSNHQFYRRRSSSVPAMLCADAHFLFHTAMPGANNSMTLGQMARKSLTQRPSTSMDFTCAGPNATFSDAFDYAQFTAQGGAPSTHWRTGHRRSISAPGLGEMTELVYHHGASGNPQEANPLTPINPVFGSVFERFTWPSESNSSFNLADFAANGRRGSQLTVTIPKTPLSSRTVLSSAMPSTTTSSASTFPPSLESSPVPISGRKMKPTILQPAPITKFDVAVFEAHIRELESFTGALRVEDPFSHADNLGFDNMLGLSDTGPWAEVSQNSELGTTGGHPETEIITDITRSKTLDFHEFIVDNY